jgi:hypothetical protein
MFKFSTIRSAFQKAKLIPFCYGPARGRAYWHLALYGPLANLTGAADLHMTCKLLERQVFGLSPLLSSSFLALDSCI